MISKGEHKLFLIDAYALIYRAYFAFSKNPRITSKGFDTSAIYGFTNILLDLIKTEQPSYLGVVFDTPKKTHRHIEYSNYKANRDAMPEGISEAIPYIKKILEAFKIPILFVDGFEADDVIGTLVKQAEKQGWKSYMMTPDKDFAQLVTINTFIYRPGIRGNPNEIWDINKVCEKFDIDNVAQVIDFLAMVGDAVDNIPGITGVGPKTASRLLKKYGSVEKTYDAIHEIEGKLKDKILQSKTNAFLSKRLATIIIDAPIRLDKTSLMLSEPDSDKLKKLFNELEFKRIFERVYFNKDVEKNKIQTTNSGQLDMFVMNPELKNAIFKKGMLISNTQSLKACRDKLLHHQSIGFFILYNKNKPVGLSISESENKIYYILFNSVIDISIALDLLTPIFIAKDIEKIFFDSKFFLQILLDKNIRIEGLVFDIILADYLINPDTNRTILGIIQKYEIETVNIELLNLTIEEDQVNYLIEGASLIIQMKKLLLPLLDKNHLKKLLYNVELPLVNVLLRMENNGISINEDALLRYSKDLTKKLSVLEKRIFTYADVKFNIASPKQLGDIIFNKMKLSDNPKKTKSGQFSTNESELVKLIGKHKIIDDILLFRTYQKLLTTYVNALPLLINDHDNKIHSTFNQTITTTGRLSSSNPNLQNIPIRKDAGKDVRKAFIPSGSNHILMSSDYSQIELRLIAELSNESNMIQAFLNNEDIHTATASKVFKASLNNVTPSMRASAKIVNFGIIYGVSAFGLSEQSTLTRKEAAELIELYFQTYPKLRLFIDNQIEFARKHGYVETILGRKRYLRSINSRNSFIRKHDERNAVNMPIQGSAADIIKLAMIKIHNELITKNLKSKMVLQVHDELVFDVWKPEKEIISEIVKKNMENIYPTTVPLKVDIGFGENWLEAH